MLPIKIDEPLRRPPWITLTLIIVCAAIFIRQNPSVAAFGLVPLDFVYTLVHPDRDLVSSLIVLTTSFFLHGNLLHLAGNLWYLWLFGSAVENSTGPWRFVLLYFLSGIFSMVTQVAVDPFSTIPVVGASGAIAGLMGMMLVLKPLSKIVFGFPPLFSFRVYSFIFLLLWFWLQWKNAGNFKQEGNNIAWWAHVGGFATGVLYAFRLRIQMKNGIGKRPKKRFN